MHKSVVEELLLGWRVLNQLLDELCHSSQDREQKQGRAVLISQFGFVREG